MGVEPPVNRRLAAILAADIAGYSRLMHEDEAATVRDLKAHQSAVLPLIGGHGGRIIDTAGDGILAEFPSVVGATECAVEIQTVMAARNENTPEHRRMRFRIGLNLGDVIHDDTRLYGDGINIGARLEALAAPGGVLVSSTVYDQVRGKLPLTFEDAGERQLKNIDQPVRTYRVHFPGAPTTAPAALVGLTGPANRRRWIVPGVTAALLVLLAVGGAWWMSPRLFGGQRGDGTPAPRLSIVVLPFTNLSGDPSQDYFADGVTEDLTTDLSRLAGSFVISRNTAFTFKGKAVDARQVGRELGVRYVLEGSVRRTGRTARVNAQLIDAGSGAHLWAEQMDVDQGTLTTSQDNFGIASRLARTLSVELINVEGRRAPRPNPDAVDLTMRGWSTLNSAPQQDDAKRSVTAFEDALRIDPDNSQARIGLAHALTLIHRNRWDPKRAPILARADEAVTRAIALAPNDAHAHYVKAEVLALSRRFDAALATYDRAIALDPNLAAAYVARGRSLIAIGRAAEATAPGSNWRRTDPHILTIRRFARSSSGSSREHARPACRNAEAASTAREEEGLAMAELPRLNGLIKVLEEGGVAFVGSAPADGAAGTSAPYDGALFEMEHGPYDIRALQEGLQSMLDRRQIAQRGVAPAVTPIVRIPPNQGQTNWVAKQVLDIGVYGIIWPHVDTVEDAYNAVAAMRYPRVQGRPLREPFGRRGDAPQRAVTYWGVSQQEYYARADVWPLNPQGELLCCLMIESPEGIGNLPKMLAQVPGIGVVFTGEGDLSQELGHPRQYDHPDVLKGVREILSICKAHKVPNGWFHTTLDNVEQVIEDGYRVLMAPSSRSYAVLNKGRAAAGRG